MAESPWEEKRLNRSGAGFVGVDIYDIHLNKRSDPVTQVPVMVWHQDQVIALVPDSAEVLGG